MHDPHSMLPMIFVLVALFVILRSSFIHKKIIGIGQGFIDSARGKTASSRAANRAFPDFLRFRNELLTGAGGFQEQLSGMRNDFLLLEAQQNLFVKAPGIINKLEGDLRTGALASTAGGSIAALESARVAAGGRGGLAFGGGAAGIAAAGARASAPQQAAALAAALGQTAGMRLQNISQQADFAFNKRAQELALRQQFLAGAFGLAGGGQQAIAGAQQAGISAQSAFTGDLIGLGAAALGKK